MVSAWSNSPAVPDADTSTLPGYTVVLMPNLARYWVSALTAPGVWPYLPVHWSTESSLVRPLVTDDSSCGRLRSLRMKETCSGVPAGVSPKTDAPGSADARSPVGTFSGVLGPGVEAAWAVPAVAAADAAT